MAMNTYVDAIPNSNDTLGLFQYVEDTCLVPNGPSSCNQLLKVTKAWMKRSEMKPAINNANVLA